MVEYAINLDSVFQSLADPTRRDILRRVARDPLSISDIALHYDLTFAAVSKHLQVLQRAKLIRKRRQGKQQIVTAAPRAMREASDHLKQYEAMWNSRFNNLENILKEEV